LTLQTPDAPLSLDAFEAALRRIGVERYHNLHRFHRRLHGGQCSRAEVAAWALNRYYYQSMIPIKDATILTRMTDPALRREWRKRIEDHDGMSQGDGGIERWLRLTDSLGLSRDEVTSTRHILPATRFAVEAYVDFCRSRSLLEAIASSLTELFSPTIIGERVSGMLAHYDFVSRDTLAYFTARPEQAKRDSDFALDYVKAHARSRSEQQAALNALSFKCDVLWVQLDGLWTAYVEGAAPPGAWEPPRDSSADRAA
jgi:coenzyme PQQ biosynthesis protein C